MYVTYCTNCGNKITDSAVSFCIKCGTKVKKDTSKGEAMPSHASGYPKIAIFAAVLVIAALGFFVFNMINRGPEARIMEIFSIDGIDVSMTRGTAVSVTARAGARLHDGYGVSTGYDSICHIRLDTDSLVRMDSHSRISVNRASATTLSISVVDGQILIDVQNQNPGHEMEIQIGNFAIGVRGTLFIVGLEQVIMLEGSVYVDDALPVSAGYVMTLREDILPEVEPIRLEDLDEFAIQAVIDYRERVLAAGTFTEEELDLFLRLRNIPDYIWIQGVQYSTELTELSITSHFLTNDDIEQLVYMVNLTSLTLRGPSTEPAGYITDITPLAGLTNLETLILNNFRISDVSPISGLTNLRRLVLNNNQISDISPLYGFAGLWGLELNNNLISDISPIVGIFHPHAFPNLALSYNQISDLSPLAELPRFVRLELNNNQISDLAPLAGMAHLYHLHLNNNQISDVTPLAGLTNLIELHLNNNNISNISPLSELQ